MAHFDPLPVYEPHDSAVLPTKRELLQAETPSSRSVDQVEQVTAVHKDSTDSRLTEFDIFRHGRLRPRTGEQTQNADSVHTQPSQTGTKYCSWKS